MANVGFKLGLQSALDELLKLGTGAKAVEGSFYLTSDTHRLYIGNADGSLSPVNQGVLTVDKLKAETGDAEGTTYLPSAATAEQTGGFYYVKSGNILCVASGGKWIQINAVKTIQSVGNSLTKTGDSEVTVTTTVGVGESASNVDTKSDTLAINASGSVHAAVGIGKNIVSLVGDKYALSAATESEEVKLKLTSDTAADSTEVVVKAGNDIAVSTDDSGALVIASTAVDTDTNTDTQLSALGFVPAENDGNGFKVTATQQIHDMMDGGKVTTTVPITTTFDPTITIGDQEIHFIGGTAELDVYTKAEIQESLRALNAMTYVGTVGVNGSAGDNVAFADDGSIEKITKNGADLTYRIGDTFLVCSDISLDGQVAITKGSLLVAKGVEDTDKDSATYGQIISGLAFDSVSNSSDTDTQYTLIEATSGVKLKAIGSPSGVTVGSLSVVGGEVTDGASVNVTKSVSGSDVTLTVKHDTVDAPAETKGDGVDYHPEQEGQKFTVLTGVSSDATGHLNGYTTSEIELGKVSVSESFTAAASTTDGVSVATLTPVTKVSSVVNGTTTFSNTNGTAISLKSESLTLTQPAASTVQVEMVWGSF